MIDRPPEYGMTCHCGMRITGTNEKGLVSLFAKHWASGEYHIAYESLQTDFKDYDQEEIVDKAIWLRTNK